MSETRDGPADGTRRRQIGDLVVDAAARQVYQRGNSYSSRGRSSQLSGHYPTVWANQRHAGDIRSVMGDLAFRTSACIRRACRNLRRELDGDSTRLRYLRTVRVGCRLVG